MSSATTAMLGLGLALGIRRQQIIAAPYTYGATVAPWMLLENEIVFADVDAATLSLQPEAVNAAMTKRVAAIVAVDADGVPCEVERLRRIANDHGVPLIVDSAQGFGAKVDLKPAGQAADAVVLSFTAGKQLYAGEGGAVATNNRDLYDRLIWWTQHPMRQQRELGLRKTNEFGINGRIHPAAAALADKCFDSAVAHIERRQRDALVAVEALNDSGMTQVLPYSADGICPSFFRLTAAWRGRTRFGELASLLGSAGHNVVLSERPMEPVYRQAAFQAIQRRKAPRLPQLEDQARRRFGVLLVRSAHKSLTEDVSGHGSDQLYTSPPQEVSMNEHPGVQL